MARASTADHLGEAQLLRQGTDCLLVLAEDVGVLKHHRHARDAHVTDSLVWQCTGREYFCAPGSTPFPLVLGPPSLSEV